MAKNAPPEPDGGRFPVFVDDTGRRHRRLRVAAWCVGVLAASYVALFVLSLVSSPALLPLSLPGIGRLLPNAGAPDIGVPGQGRSKVSTVVATSTPTPTPAASVPNSGPGSVPTPATTQAPGHQPSTRPTPTARPTTAPSAHGSPTARPTTRGTGQPTARPTSGRGHSPTARPQQSHR